MIEIVAQQVWLVPEATDMRKSIDGLTYTVQNWEKLSYYVKDGRWPIDNNIAEREIKAVVIGRKNWLSSDSVEGAHTIAIMHSLVATARAKALDPFKYLTYVIECCTGCGWWHESAVMEFSTECNSPVCQ